MLNNFYLIAQHTLANTFLACLTFELQGGVPDIVFQKLFFDLYLDRLHVPQTSLGGNDVGIDNVDMRAKAP